jgi:SAM-dependent methyltransferase
MKNIDFGPVADLYDVYVQWDVDVPFFQEMCTGVPGEVLELMSGTGRLSIPLLQSGIRLCCVDYSAEMLAILRQRLREHDLTANVYEQDVRSLDLGRSFGLVLLPFHSFSEVMESSDRTGALRRIGAHLAPGGRVVITLYNPAVQIPLLDGVRRQVCDRPIPGRGAALRVWMTAQYHPDRGVAEGIQDYAILAEDGQLLETRTLPLRFAIIERATLEKEATEAGFRVLRLWGDYAGGRFEPERSPYMIWELGRAAA